MLAFPSDFISLVLSSAVKEKTSSKFSSRRVSVSPERQRTANAITVLEDGRRVAASGSGRLEITFERNESASKVFLGCCFVSFHSGICSSERSHPRQDARASTTHSNDDDHWQWMWKRRRALRRHPP